MRNFFRVTTILLLAFFLASCKQKTQNTSPIADCVVFPNFPAPVYSDAEETEQIASKLPVYTKLTIIEQSGEHLKVKFKDEDNAEKTGYVPLRFVTLNTEIFDKTVNLALDGDENAKILFKYEFEHFSNEEAVKRLPPLLERFGDKLQTADLDDDIVSLVFPKFQDVAGLAPNTTNPLHLLIPYANEQILSWFDQGDMRAYDSEGRSCLMLAVKAENVEAVKYFYERSKNDNLDDLKHKDNEGRSIIDYIDNCQNDAIKEMLVLCRYDVPSLISQCVEYLAQTQNDRELAAEALTEESEDKQTILLTQKEFARGDTPIVVCQSEMFLPDGTKALLNPADEVEIVRRLSDNLVEYDEYKSESSEKYYTRYNFYLVRFKDKVGIVGGSALCHGELPMGAHWGISAKTDTIKLFVNYKYINYIYTNESEYFADLYEYDFKKEQMRKLDTGFVENEMHFESEPISLGNNRYWLSLSQFEQFYLKGTDSYLCVFEYYPFSWDDNYSIYAIYAVRDNGTAFSLGRFGGSQEECAEMNNSYRLEMSETTGEPEFLEVFNYGYWSRNLETGEKENPFTITQKYRFDSDALRFEEDGDAEIVDYLPEF